MTTDELRRLVFSRHEDDRYAAAIELQEGTCELSDDLRLAWWARTCLALPTSHNVVPYTGRRIPEEEVEAWRGHDGDKFRWTWTAKKWLPDVEDPDEAASPDYHGPDEVDGDLGPRPTGRWNTV